MKYSMAAYGNRPRHHNEILQTSLGSVDLVKLYKRCPDMFDFAPLSFRERIRLLNLNYSVFKTAFKFQPKFMHADDLFELYLVDPPKYRRYIDLGKLNKDQIWKLALRRPRMFKTLELDFNKFCEHTWAALLKHDYIYYAPLFFEHIVSIRQKMNLRRVFTESPTLFRQLTPEVVDRSCLDSKNYIIIISKLLCNGECPFILETLKEHLKETAMLGILAGKFKNSKQFTIALGHLEKADTY